MYGLIAKLTAAPGKRDELMTILIDGTRDMPGCFSYTVAKDSADENVVWVTETWDSQASHDASLTLPAVKNSITQAKPLIAGLVHLLPNIVGNNHFVGFVVGHRIVWSRRNQQDGVGCGCNQKAPSSERVSAVRLQSS